MAVRAQEFLVICYVIFHTVLAKEAVFPGQKTKCQYNTVNPTKHMGGYLHLAKIMSQCYRVIS